MKTDETIAIREPVLNPGDLYEALDAIHEDVTRYFHPSLRRPFQRMLAEAMDRVVELIDEEEVG